MINTYILCDGLTYNTRGYFASCVVFFPSPAGARKTTSNQRILNNNGIRPTTRPVKTLQQEFASPKSKPPPDRQTNVVYKIPCADCTWNYIGEMGRCLHTRKKEHIRNTKVFKSGSNVASHAWLKGHTIDFENAHVIDRGNSRIRKTLESWHRAITSQADNNSK